MLQSVSSQYTTTYRGGNTQHLVHIRTEKKRINWGLIDQAADEKFSGGYNLSKSNLCTSCNEYKSVNGACSC
jgi:hypothetical protein